MVAPCSVEKVHRTLPIPIPSKAEEQSRRSSTIQRMSRSKIMVPTAWYLSLPFRPLPLKCSHSRTGNGIPPGCFPLLPLLLLSADGTRRDVFHLDELLHLQYLSSSLWGVWMVDSLHTSMQTEGDKSLFLLFAETDGRTTESDFEVGSWLGGRCGCSGRFNRAEKDSLDMVN